MPPSPPTLVTLSLACLSCPLVKLEVSWRQGLPLIPVSLPSGSPEDRPLQTLYLVASEWRRSRVLGSLSKGFSNEYFWDFTGLQTAGSVLTQSPPFGELNCVSQASRPVSCPGFSCYSVGGWHEVLKQGISVPSPTQFLEDNPASHVIRRKCKLSWAGAPGQWLRAPWCPPETMQVAQDFLCGLLVVSHASEVGEVYMH